MTPQNEAAHQTKMIARNFLLRKMRDEQKLTYRELGKFFNISIERARQIYFSTAARKAELEHGTPVLLARTANVLKNSFCIFSITELNYSAITAKDILRAKNSGKATLEDLVAACKRYNIAWPPEETPETHTKIACDATMCRHNFKGSCTKKSITMFNFWSPEVKSHGFVCADLQLPNTRPVSKEQTDILRGFQQCKI